MYYFILIWSNDHIVLLVSKDSFALRLHVLYTSWQNPTSSGASCSATYCKSRFWSDTSRQLLYSLVSDNSRHDALSFCVWLTRFNAAGREVTMPTLWLCQELNSRTKCVMPRLHFGLLGTWVVPSSSSTQIPVSNECVDHSSGTLSCLFVCICLFVCGSRSSQGHGQVSDLTSQFI